MLYEMLTGRRPFEGKSQASLIGAILDHQPPPVSASQPVSPPMLDDIVAQCLAKDPDERWQSVRDLKRQLEWVAKSLLEGGAATALPGQAQHVSQMGMRTRALRVGAAIITSAAIAGGAAAWDDPAIVVHELATGQRTVLVNGGTDARVLPTGHLVYSREATLFAVLFDEARLVVAGGAVPVQQGIQQASSAASGAAQRAWSDAGAFVFVTGSTTSIDRALVWINRQGKEQGANLPNRGYGFFGSLRVSPDGARVAVLVVPTTAGSGAGAGAGNAAQAGGGADIWVGDIARGTLARLTFAGQATSLVWTPDGRRVCYTRGDEVFCQAADGSGQAQAMFKAEGLREVRSISPDGTRMLAMATLPKTLADIMVTTIGPPSETRALIQTTHDEYEPAISPDGRWVAYTSNESGRVEVYVRPFPAVDQGRWQISTDGGFEVRWARNGRELFFLSGRGGGNLVLLSASVQPGPVFLPGTPAVVMTCPATTSGAYDVALTAPTLSGARGAACCSCRHSLY